MALQGTEMRAEAAHSLSLSLSQPPRPICCGHSFASSVDAAIAVNLVIHPERIAHPPALLMLSIHLIRPTLA